MTTQRDTTQPAGGSPVERGVGRPVEGAPMQAWGVIDPDYARIFTQARIVAWQYGWACLAHGSFTRDLDLLLVPWTEGRKEDPAYLVRRIADVCGLDVQGDPSDKPHGRKAWSLLLPGFSEVRWVDVSAYPSSKTPNAKLTGAAGATEVT